mgnify:CR=1 FL=1
MYRNELDWLEVLCEDFACTRALTVAILVRNAEWEQLVSLKCSPSDYCHVPVRAFGLNRKRRHLRFMFQSPDDFRLDYNITEILRKCESLPIDVDRKAAAIATYRESERTNKITNIRLRTLRLELFGGLPSQPKNEVWYRLVNATREVVKQILPTTIPDYINYKFSSGSTFDDRRHLMPMDKMSNRPTVTSQAYEVLSYDWGKTLWSKSLCAERPYRSLPRIVRGNRFVTVPKTALTDRGICIGPSLNVTSQLSVGKVIRKSLRRQGLDLKFGQAVHQGLVKSASLKLDVGTIDLSAASDSVSYELVKLLLPENWFELLDALREPETFIEGNWEQNEKFSAMGNGYTFELETLIFYSLAVALCNCMNYNWNTISVYGDDIIIDSPMCSNLIKALQFFGFKTNPRKTYVDGIPFRESCGADFYAGYNVRGHYLESIPKEPTEWIKLANGIRRMGTENSCDNDFDSRYLRAWFRAIDHVPRQLQSIRGPVAYGDLVIQDTDWRRYNQPYRGSEGRVSIRTLQPQYAREDFRSYDERYWTRGSIIAAATLKSLSGMGDTQTRRKNKWVLLPGRILRRNSQPQGWHVKRVEYVPQLENPTFVQHIERFLSRSAYSYAPRVITFVVPKPPERC